MKRLQYCLMAAIPPSSATNTGERTANLTLHVKPLIKVTLKAYLILGYSSRSWIVKNGEAHGDYLEQCSQIRIKLLTKIPYKKIA